MRTLLLPILLCAFSAAADDDGYYQRQMESRLQDQRMESQRLENQRIEAQRIAQQQVQRAQDRVDQQRTDERFDRQQAQAQDIRERGAAQQRQYSDAMMRIALQQGLQRSRNKKEAPSGSICEPLVLPREQAVDDYINGYFAPESGDPYFISRINLGPEGKNGNLSLTAFIRKGALPAVVKQFHLELLLRIPGPSGEVRSFKGAAGSVEFSAAIRDPAKGRFSVELKDLVLVEMDGFVVKPGGACLSTPTFHFSANWTQPPSAR